MSGTFNLTKWIFDDHTRMPWDEGIAFTDGEVKAKGTNNFKLANCLLVVMDKNHEKYNMQFENIAWKITVSYNLLFEMKMYLN